MDDGIPAGTYLANATEDYIKDHDIKILDDDRSYSLLEWVMRKEHNDIFDTLYPFKFTIGVDRFNKIRVLCDAMKYGTLHMIKTIMDDIEKTKPAGVRRCMCGGCYESAASEPTTEPYLISNHEFQNILYITINANRLDVMQYCIDKGYHYHLGREYNPTPLFDKGYLEMLMLILSNSINKELILQVRVDNEDHYIVKKLLDLGIYDTMFVRNLVTYDRITEKAIEDFLSAGIMTKGIR